MEESCSKKDSYQKLDDILTLLLHLLEEKNRVWLSKKEEAQILFHRGLLIGESIGGTVVEHLLLLQEDIFLLFYDPSEENREKAIKAAIILQNDLFRL